MDQVNYTVPSVAAGTYEVKVSYSASTLVPGWNTLFFVNRVDVSLRKTAPTLLGLVSLCRVKNSNKEMPTALTYFFTCPLLRHFDNCFGHSVRILFGFTRIFRKPCMLWDLMRKTFDNYIVAAFSNFFP